MSRFHISKDGKPAPCKAKPGNCPLGGDDQHFKTEQEAQKFADNQGEQKHGLLPGMKEDKPKRRKAKAEFQMSKGKWNEYKGKFVEVDYEEKVFSGEVLDTYYKDKEDSGLIIQSRDGEIKHIKNYRMDDVLITANDKETYGKQAKQLEDFHDEIADDFENDFVKQNSDAHLDLYIYNDNMEPVNPDVLIDEYFKAVIDREEKGISIDENKFNPDWEKEVIDNKDIYVINHGGGDERWTEESDDNFEYEKEAAEKVGEYFDEQKAYIDHVVNKANETDWTKYGKSQLQGVVDASKEVHKREYYK